MNKKIFLLCIIIVTFFIVGCQNDNMTEEELIKAKKEENKLSEVIDIIDNLDETICDFILYDVQDNDCYVSDLDLENMKYEVEKARNKYNELDFHLLEKNCKYRISQGEEDKIHFNEDALKSIEKNYSDTLDLYQKIIELGYDGSYSNQDYDKLEEYQYKIIDNGYIVKIYNSKYDNFFKFYALYASNIFMDSTIKEIEEKIEETGYTYEYDEDSNETIKNLIVYDKNSKDSVHFMFKDDILNTVFYYINDNDDMFLFYSISASSNKMIYRGNTPELSQYKEFNDFNEQYQFLQDIKKE